MIVAKTRDDIRLEELEERVARLEEHNAERELAEQRLKDIQLDLVRPMFARLNKPWWHWQRWF